MLLEPVIAAAALFALATLLGLWCIRKLIEVYEAAHELRRGSAGWLRTIGGWSLVALWALGTWYCATIIGDWGVSGDLDGAVARSWLRLQIVIEIALAVLDSD